VAATPRGVECGPCPVFESIYALAFALQLRKIAVKPQSGRPKSARLISAGHDLFRRLGHRLAVASTGLLVVVAFGLNRGRRGQPSARVGKLMILKCAFYYISFTRITPSPPPPNHCNDLHLVCVPVIGTCLTFIHSFIFHISIYRCNLRMWKLSQCVEYI
jgi:hypothetical protein